MEARMHQPTDRALRWCLVLSVALGLSVFAASAASAQTYVGAETCAAQGCHPGQYSDWQVSGHPWKLVSSEVARNRNLPTPEGFSWDDISYVIGGYKWKSRYMGLDGYIITTVETDEGPVDGMNQYNMMTGGWVDYHPGEMKPYDCGRCHTTGWVADDDADTDNDLSDNQDGLPGIHGTFEYGGVQCEACHGPGSDHGPNGLPKDPSSALCGQCHIRGASNTIPASGGFIRHHEQWNEQLASPHRDLNCVDCHNPHKKAEFSIVRDCATCHEDVAASYAGTTMDVRGVACEDCHMPMASKSAAAAGPFQGDIKTHLFGRGHARLRLHAVPHGRGQRLAGWKGKELPSARQELRALVPSLDPRRRLG
jgi:predicted CXXCH cytochrome family protein